MCLLRFYSFHSFNLIFFLRENILKQKIHSKDGWSFHFPLDLQEWCYYNFHRTIKIKKQSFFRNCDISHLLQKFLTENIIFWVTFVSNINRDARLAFLSVTPIMMSKMSKLRNMMSKRKCADVYRLVLIELIHVLPGKYLSYSTIHDARNISWHCFDFSTMDYPFQ